MVVFSSTSDLCEQRQTYVDCLLFFLMLFALKLLVIIVYFASIFLQFCVYKYYNYNARDIA